MGRKATGTIFWGGKNVGYKAKVWVQIPGEEKPKRVTKTLGTKSKSVAERKLATIVASENPGAVDDPEIETLAQAGRRVVEQQRDEDGLITWRERLSRLERYAFAFKVRGTTLGDLPVTEVDAAALDDVLRDAAKGGKDRPGLSAQSVTHLRNDLGGIFKELWRTELVSENPILKVRLPRSLRKTDPRKPLQLEDDEFVALVMAETTPDRLRAMALAARYVGGMRTSDLHAWDWSHIQTPSFASAFVYRPKTDKQADGAPIVTSELTEIEIDPAVRPYLEAWWKARGEPTKGPVFPVAKGAKAGKPQTKRSHVRELRNALWAAGVVRKLDGFDAAWKGLLAARNALRTLQATPEGKGKVREARAAVQAADATARTLCALQSDTDQTLATTMHSLRAAYATGLASAGVPPEVTRKLMGHASYATTAKHYVRVQGMLAAPSGSLPKGLPAPITSAPVDRKLRKSELSVGDSSENRTRVTGVRGQCPNR